MKSLVQHGHNLAIKKGGQYACFKIRQVNKKGKKMKRFKTTLYCNSSFYLFDGWRGVESLGLQLLLGEIESR